MTAGKVLGPSVMYGVGVSGAKGSGKDSFADMLVARYNFRKDHFAFSLKKAATDHFGWDGKKEIEEGEPGLKGRRLLQLLGTEVGRKYCDLVWIIKTARRQNLRWDERLPDETVDGRSLMAAALSAIHPSVPGPEQKARLVALKSFSWNGVLDEAGRELIQGIIRVGSEYRPDLWRAPEAHLYGDVVDDIADRLLQRERRDCVRDLPESLALPDTRFGNEHDFCFYYKMFVVDVRRPGKERSGHASETSLSNAYVHAVIHNDKTLEDLSRKVDVFMEKAKNGELLRAANNRETIHI